MVDLLNDIKFREFLASAHGRYQPIPISGLYNHQAVRAEGCNLRWKAIKRILPQDTPLRILDIGCSLGYFGLVGADSGLFVDGFDTDGEAIFWGNKVIEEYNIPNVTLRQSNNDLLQELCEIPEGVYDYVFYFSLHHHMYATLGDDKAKEILREISRIAPNMIFDMGQSNEVDNGWLTWLKKIPQFKNHRVELPEWVLENSGFNYAACIGGSPSHEVSRLLFLFVRDVPEDVVYDKKLITTKKRGYNIKCYVWKHRGGRGQTQKSTTSFPVMDLKSNMTSRFYLAEDVGGVTYFIKEYLNCWLSPNKNYELAYKSYERAKALQNIKEIRNRVISPEDLEGNIVIYPYYNAPPLHTIPKEEIKHNFFDELLEVAGLIYQEIGVFDLNPNNIIYNNKTGDFWLIDFEPGDLETFSFRIFNARLSNLYTLFNKIFKEREKK